MLTDKQLEELYQTTFATANTFEEISNRLHSLKNEYTDELRSILCNQLLYNLSIGYTKYDKLNEEINSLISLFCYNVELLPKSCLYFRAVRAFFYRDNKQCLSLIDQYLQEDATANPGQPLDEFFVVDCFFEPFKEAFPGFWNALGELIKKYPHQPFLPDMCSTIGRYYTCGTDEEALELLMDSYQQYNDSILIKELIGYTYYSMKMWKNAVAYFEQVEDRRLFFRNDAFFFMMAWCYGKNKDYKLEEKFYLETLENDPQNIDALNNLGYSYYSQKRYNEAKAVFEKCMGKDKNYVYALNNYVRVLIALGKYRDAKAFINQGHKISSDLKRKVERLEDTNKGKACKVSKEANYEEISDNTTTQQPQIDIGIKRQQFSSEKLLEDELTARIESGMEIFGKKLKLFRRKGLYGRQFIIPIGRLDLLCEDDAGNLYVIELKKDSGYDDAYQQTANYLDWFEQSNYAKDKNVYGIICLNSPTNALVQKVRNDKRMRLFEYAISYTEV